MQLANLSISNYTIKCVDIPLDIHISLAHKEVFLYAIHLPKYADIIHYLFNFLTKDEHNRAEKYFNSKDKNRFIVCRSLLRIILGYTTNLDPGKIILAYNLNKKPYLPTHRDVHFNVSHSGDYALIALSRNEIGVDVEYVSEHVNFETLLPTVFSEKEILEIQNSQNKKHAFYSLWTRKEAFAKAIGKGIDDEFKYIPCLNGQHTIPPSLAQNNKNWQLYTFNLDENYLGSISFQNTINTSKNLIMYKMPHSISLLLQMIRY